MAEALDADPWVDLHPVKNGRVFDLQLVEALQSVRKGNVSI